MSNDDGGPSVDRTHNAGQAADPYNLEFTRADAQARATALGEPVQIFKHIGGQHPVTRKRTQATGAYLWRDVQDEAGTPFPPPRYYEPLERVEPAAI